MAPKTATLSGRPLEEEVSGDWGAGGGAGRGGVARASGRARSIPLKQAHRSAPIGASADVITDICIAHGGQSAGLGAPATKTDP